MLRLVADIAFEHGRNPVYDPLLRNIVIGYSSTTMKVDMEERCQ